jgi:hypothetical protein
MAADARRRLAARGRTPDHGRRECLPRDAREGDMTARTKDIVLESHADGIGTSPPGTPDFIRHWDACQAKQATRP